jgi:hypothetical protein
MKVVGEIINMQQLKILFSLSSRHLRFEPGIHGQCLSMEMYLLSTLYTKNPIAIEPAASLSRTTRLA